MRFNTIAAHLHRFAPRLVETMLQIAVTNAAREKEFTDLYWRLAREDRIYLYFREAFNLYRCVKDALPVGGAIAEVGVFKGGGAKLMCELKGSVPLRLFDTFEGMPETRPDIDTYKKGAFSDTSVEGVRKYLEGYPNVTLHQGIFPSTAGQVPADETYCFVNLDVDIYESTLEGLKFFYPRLRKGGILLSHDYNTHYCQGVKRAFDEYFAGTGVTVTPMWDTQCMVRKETT